MLTHCPVCTAIEPPILFERVCNFDGNETDILQCRSCLALINSRAHELLTSTSVEQVQQTEYYSLESTKPEEERRRLEENRPILNHLFDKIDRPWEHLTFCDFGAGRGYISILAAERFKASFACEFDVRNVEQVVGTLGKMSNHSIVKALDEISTPIDVFFMWHVLEHIPEPGRFLQEHRPRFSDNCILFLQCPGYRPKAVVDCHYTFFNEPSFRSIFEDLGFREIEIGFDRDNGFISYLGELK